jgi:hypothetical protein
MARPDAIVLLPEAFFLLPEAFAAHPDVFLRTPPSRVLLIGSGFRVGVFCGDHLTRPSSAHHHNLVRFCQGQETLVLGVSGIIAVGGAGWLLLGGVARPPVCPLGALKQGLGKFENEGSADIVGGFGRELVFAREV